MNRVWMMQPFNLTEEDDGESTNHKDVNMSNEEVVPSPSSHATNNNKEGAPSPSKLLWSVGKQDAAEHVPEKEEEEEDFHGLTEETTAPPLQPPCNHATSDSAEATVEEREKLDMFKNVAISNGFTEEESKGVSLSKESVAHCESAISGE
eukprot:8468733-Ditylum_brightwellii.AAC.1